MTIKRYNHIQAVNYAKKWALSRNPKYYNFDKLGGDCTNFVSQCIYTGSNIMNYLPNGWYYNSLNDRSPSWTSVEFLYNFLKSNKNAGPFCELTNKDNILIGDVIQIGNGTAPFHHSLIVTKIENNNIFTSSHTNDSLDKPLSSYKFSKVRYIHILGVRV